MTAQVDVIVPFRNQGAWLRQACASLQRQTMPCWRALLINDQSTPDVVGLAQQLSQAEPRFRLLHLTEPKPAPGPWLARNLGLHSATAPLVSFLDADDLWHPLKLEHQLALHQGEAGQDVLSVCAYHRFDAISLKVEETRTPPPALLRHQLWRGNPIPLSSVIMARPRLLQSGGFRPEHHEDYGLWLRLFHSAHPPRYRCLPKALMAYRLHHQSVSAARYRSILAVNELFRQHMPQRHHRWPALVHWSLERSRVALTKRKSSELPEAFLSLIEDGYE